MLMCFGLTILLIRFSMKEMPLNWLGLQQYGLEVPVRLSIFLRATNSMQLFLMQDVMKTIRSDITFLNICDRIVTTLPEAYSWGCLGCLKGVCR